MIATVDGINRDVFRRYAGLSLPRHVSYPMPTWWHDLDSQEAESMYKHVHRRDTAPDLSLYLHIPFCETLCKFCACNRVIQRHDARGAAEYTEHYIEALLTEVRRHANTIGSRRPLRQVHYGGGSPTYLTNDQIARIQHTLFDAFTLAPNAEVAIEVDPRTVSSDRLRFLRTVGFNRVSMGVQDFDEQVQTHVRRVQPFDLVRSCMEACRELEFESVNFDLIYGMPYQTPDTVRDTVDKTITLGPDRIAYYHYAQIPERIATQRGMDYTRLPDSESKLRMFLIGLDRFEEAGYEFIGLDHFARPDEALTEARKTGTLQRNFQGMTTGGGLCLVGLGVSAISHIPQVGFLQNVKDIDRYITLVEKDALPVERGKSLTRDDCIRQAVINQLYCTAAVQPQRIEAAFDIRFEDYFSREMSVLHELQRDGLVRITREGGLVIERPLGRVLMRNIAAVFDAYLDPQAYRKGEKTCFSQNA